MSFSFDNVFGIDQLKFVLDNDNQRSFDWPNANPFMGEY